MTDEELKELVASLAVSHKEMAGELKSLTEGYRESRESMNDFQERLRESQEKNMKSQEEFREFQEEFREFQEIFRESQEKLRESQEKTDRQIAATNAQQAKTDAQLAKTDAQLAKTDAQLAKTDVKLDKLAKMYGGVANNQGDVTEEFFFNSLKANPVLNGIHFDYLERNVLVSHKNLQDEFDILMVNGKDVFIIEVKYKAHEKDLTRLIEKKAQHFKELMPLYQDFRQHLGLAGFHINEELKVHAIEQGVTVLQRKGDLIETTAGHC